MTAAAFTAEFADFKIIKGRKVVVICLEIPLEQADKALAVLGGIPNPAESRHVAVARLETQPAKVEKPARERLTSERAAMLCRDLAFADWLFKRAACDDPKEPVFIATVMREVLMVDSRRELDTNPEARARFESLEREYQEASR